MTARSPEDTPSNEPERREQRGQEPSQELLDKIMERPRFWQEYLGKLVDERYPDDDKDLKNPIAQKVQNKKIALQLDLFEKEISSKDFDKKIDEFRALALIDPSVRKFNDLLTPAIIYRNFMSMLFQALAQFNAPSDQAIHAAQVKLALETYSILEYQQSIPSQDGAYLNQQILDLGAMITKLGTLLPASGADDKSVKSIKGTAIISNPHHNPLESLFREPEFLIFTPTEPSALDKREATTSGILPKNAKPGEIALQVLEQASFREMAISPEFEGKGALDPLYVARRAIYDSYKKQNPRVEDSE